MRKRICLSFLSSLKLLAKSLLYYRSGILKKELIAMVERQVDKWPYLTGFDPKAKATTASRLRAALLDPKNGFTRAVSVTLPSSPDTSLDRDNIRDGGLGTSPTPEVSNLFFLCPGHLEHFIFIAG
jgi:hypothetical protein